MSVTLAEVVEKAIHEWIKENGNGGVVSAFILMGEMITSQGQERLFYSAPHNQSWLTTASLVNFMHESSKAQLRMTYMGEGRA